jgi:hypothetical protein
MIGAVIASKLENILSIDALIARNEVRPAQPQQRASRCGEPMTPSCILKPLYNRF